MEKKVIAWSLLIAYPITFFIPPFVDNLDYNAWHTLVINVLNVIAFSYFISIKETYNLISNIIKSSVSIAMGLFFLWALISYFYAVLPTEVIVKLILFVNFYLLFVNLSTIITFLKLSKINISLFISVCLLFQISASYYSYFRLLEYRAYDFESNNLLVGIFANRNVTAAVYLLQIPFVIFLVKEVKSIFIRNLGILILFSTLFMVFLLASRTSYVIMVFLFIFYLIRHIFSKTKIKSFLTSFFGIYSITLILAYVISSASVGFNNSANMVNRIQTIDFQETSTNTRIRYYGHAIDQLKENPFIGVGYGNWKIVSIDKDKENIISYIIPYTMHNDFLEALVELGLIGLIIYSSIFMIPLYRLRSKFFQSDKLFELVILSSLLIYIIDANINFPAIRMANIYYIALILSLFYFVNLNSNESN